VSAKRGIVRWLLWRLASFHAWVFQPPASRVCSVAAENRVCAVAAENRVCAVAAENRVCEVSA
jgi:hypothetical protein